MRLCGLTLGLLGYFRASEMAFFIDEASDPEILPASLAKIEALSVTLPPLSIVYMFTVSPV